MAKDKKGKQMAQPGLDPKLLEQRRRHGALPGESAVFRYASEDGGLSGVSDGSGNMRVGKRSKSGPDSVPDAQGKAGDPLKIYDTLARLLSSGSISQAEYRVGREFQRNFAEAHFEQLRASDPNRIPSQHGGDMSDGQAARVTAARQRVWDAVQHIGGLTSPLGGVLWDVVGLGMSAEEHIERSRFSSAKTIRGLLVAALSMLAERQESEGGAKRPRLRLWKS